jgi:uncharacterized protein (TIGR03437 family)
MTSAGASVALWGWGSRAVWAFAIISIFFGLGWPRVSEAARGDRRRVESTAPVRPGQGPRSLPLSTNHLQGKLMSVPLSFEPNQGQTDSAVQFLSRGSGYALFLTPGQVVLNLERQQPAPAPVAGQPPQAASLNTLRMSLLGANPHAIPVGLNPLPGVVSYFIGNDPKNWRSGIPTYSKVEYRQVYPGVDLVFYGNQRQLEYDFVVAPGADPGVIAWRIDGARPSLDAAGNLALSASNGPATFLKPAVYQMDGDNKTRVEGRYAVAGNELHFRLGAYDHSRALIIDPVLSYASYLAGTASDRIGLPTGPGILQAGVSQGLALDSAGSVYVAGSTLSLDFPTKNPYAGAPPAKQFGGSTVPPGQWPSAFVTKFSPDGSSLIYSTYLGGNYNDYIYAIAVDSSGSAYVTGQTNSTSFPVSSGAYQTICDPAPNNTGPSAGAASCNSANVSAFVTKLNPTGTGIVYSTFLGGYAYAYANSIAVDSAGRAYIAGNEQTYCSTQYTTYQGCFPTTSGAVIGGNATGGGSPQYAFVAVFDPTGSKLLYSTMFGDLNGFACTHGCGATWATGVAVDSSGFFYLIGETKAGKLPTTAGVIQPTGVPLDAAGAYVPSDRGFIAKFNPVTSAGGVTLAYATYLGGQTANTSDYLSGITIDSAGNAYVVGYTNSKDFPVTSGAYNTVCAPNGGTCAAAHVTKLNPSGTAILWSTYVGGSKGDGSDALFFTGPIQLDGKGNIYIMGQAGPAFPLLNPVEPAVSSGAMQVVVAELDPTGTNLLFATRIGSGAVETATSYPAGLAVNSAGDIYLAGNTIGPGLITTPGAFQTTASSSTCCYHGFVAKIAATTGPQITVTGNSSAVFNAATLRAGGIAPNEFITLKGTGLGPATGVSSAMTTQLAGSSVSIGGKAAYLTYAQEGQVNVLVPFSVSGLQNTTIQVQSNGVNGNTVTVPVVASSPGIFTQAYGPGQAWIANQDGGFNSASNPAARGAYVAFWLTGQGIVNTTLADGAQPSGPAFPAPMLPVSVSLGGTAVPAANIAFAGLVYSGEVQINLLIPANAPTGNAVPLVVTIGAASSRSDATIAIR